MKKKVIVILFVGLLPLLLLGRYAVERAERTKRFWCMKAMIKK